MMPLAFPILYSLAVARPLPPSIGDWAIYRGMPIPTAIPEISARWDVDNSHFRDLIFNTPIHDVREVSGGEKAFLKWKK